MTIIASPLATSQDAIPIVGSSQIGKFAGLHMHFPSAAAFQAAVLAEQGNVAALGPLWSDKQHMTMSGEPSSAYRIWSVSVNHARTVHIRPGMTTILAADSNVVLAAAGVPSAGTGSNGDISIDFAGNIVYVKTSGAWATSIASIWGNYIGLPQAWTGTVPALASGVNPIAFGGNAYVYTGAGGAVLDGLTYANGDTAVFGWGGTATFTKIPGGGAYLGVFANTGLFPSASANPGGSAITGTTLYFSNGVTWGATGAGGATTLGALTDMGTYDLGSNNPSVTAIKTTANAAIPSSQKGAALGVVPLDGTGHIATAYLPASVLGAQNYQGVWDANANSPALASGTGTKGFFYTVGTAGTTTLDGISKWYVGDKATYNGTVWEKIDGVASEVLTVAGQAPGAGGNVPVALANLSDGAAQQTAISGAIQSTQKAAAGGVATLDGTIHIPAAQIPAPTAGTLGGVQSATPVSNQFVTGISTAGVVTTAQPTAGNVSGLSPSATVDATNAGNISSGTLPAARLPNPSATTLGGVQSVAGAAHQFIVSISTTGVPTLSQPASTDLSDSASLERIVGTFASTGALQTAFPAATNTGNKALVGSSAPYVSYASNGSAWAKGVSASTELSDSASLERIVGTYATTGALQTAFPAAANAGNKALVGSAAPYVNYSSDGSAWNKAIQVVADLSDGAALNTQVSNNTAALTVQTTNSQTGTTYTFALTDAGQNTDLNNAAAIAATIPPHSAVPFPVGTMLYWTQAGAGVATITSGAGVTFTKRASNSYTTSELLAGGYAYQLSLDNWRIYNA